MQQDITYECEICEKKFAKVDMRGLSLGICKKCSSSEKLLDHNLFYIIYCVFNFFASKSLRIKEKEQEAEKDILQRNSFGIVSEKIGTCIAKYNNQNEITELKIEFLPCFYEYKGVYMKDRKIRIERGLETMVDFKIPIEIIEH